MNTRSNAHNNNIARWLPVGGAVGLLAAVVVAGVISGSSGNGSSAATSPTPETSNGLIGASTTTIATGPITTES